MYLLGVPRTHSRLDLPEAVADEEGSVNQHAIGRTINLEVAKEDIGTEKGEDLVDAIVGLAFGCDIHVRSIGWKSGQSVCGTASSSAQRQNREVPYTVISQCESLEVKAWVQLRAGHCTYHGDIAVLQEDGVICLKGQCEDGT